MGRPQVWEKCYEKRWVFYKTSVWARRPGHLNSWATKSRVQRRVGESNVAILWTVQTFDGELNPLGEIAGVTYTSIDDVITLTGDAVLFEICARNTSQKTATLFYDVVEPDRLTPGS